MLRHVWSCKQQQMSLIFWKRWGAQNQPLLSPTGPENSINHLIFNFFYFHRYLPTLTSWCILSNASSLKYIRPKAE